MNKDEAKQFIEAIEGLRKEVLERPMYVTHSLEAKGYNQALDDVLRFPFLPRDMFKNEVITGKEPENTEITPKTENESSSGTS